MTRVGWSTLSGEEVETVVSMLIFNEHPQATRIRPSQGDHGIDVLTPHPGDSAQSDVWQIKKFATNLDSTQRRQIEGSFRSVLIGLVRHGIQLADWYLAMPLDPTNENRSEWFILMPDRVIEEMFTDEKLALTAEEKAQIRAWRDAPDRVIEWKGLTYCETLAAKHWYVPDYYLRGGNERVRGAVADLAAILRTDGSLSVEGSSALEPADIRGHLERLGKSLDGDPHFRYGLSLHPFAPEITAEPGMIAATSRQTPDGQYLTFRIYSRFDEAVNERPIPIRLKFQVEAGSTERQAVEEWFKYGNTLTAVAGVELDLPGGLGGSSDRALLTISPASAEKNQSRYRVVDPDGVVLAQIQCSGTTSKGPDGTGMHVMQTDSRSGLVSLEGYFDLSDSSGRISFTFGSLGGREASEIVDAVEFIATLSAPNRVEIAGKVGPFSRYQDQLGAQAPLPMFVANYIRALAELQPFTATPIRVPDLTRMTDASTGQVLAAADLVSGKTLVTTWASCEFSEDEYDEVASIDSGGGFQVAFIQPLSVRVGSQELTLGSVKSTLLSAILGADDGGRRLIVPHLNNTAHQVFISSDPVTDGVDASIDVRRMPEE